MGQCFVVPHTGLVLHELTYSLLTKRITLFVLLLLGLNLKQAGADSRKRIAWECQKAGMEECEYWKKNRITHLIDK